MSIALPGRAATVRPARPRRSFRRRWLTRIGKGFLALIGLLLLCMAIPPSREFLVDQVIYQGDFFFPVSQRATVTRLVRPHPGAAPVLSTVKVVSGRIPAGTISSHILHTRRGYRIYLPPGYDNPANQHMRYPVLYLIHGSPGNAGSWLRGAHADFVANEEIAAGTARPLILVMPDLNGDAWRDTECVNKWDGSDNEVSYFVQEVAPFIDTHYRTIPRPAYRAIGGLSSGGYCAFNIGLHYPHLFHTLFSISGYFHALRGEVFGTNDPFGHDPRFIAANSPDRYVAQVPGVRQMHLLIADSTADWGYTSYATAFDRLLTHLRIPHVLLLHNPSGFHLWDHSWAYWRSAFRQVLPVVSADFGH